MFKTPESAYPFIYSQVVEPKMARQVRKAEVFNDIIDVPTYGKALDVLNKRINDALKAGEITIYQ